MSFQGQSYSVYILISLILWLLEWSNLTDQIAPQWHALSKEEQSKYYDMARRERQIHMQMYPGWNARDNYGMMKKKKRKKEKSVDGGSFTML